MQRTLNVHSPAWLIAFSLDDSCYGLALEAVERVVRVVEITALPKAPDIVLGVINVQGQVMPVVDLRGRFGLPRREAMLSDQLVIARTAKRRLALLVDRVSGVLEYSEHEAAAAEAIVPGADYIAGVVKRADGMILIQDLGRLLSLDEERTIDAALAHA